MRILIADDDRTTNQVINRRLQKWGYETITAYDGSQAWTECQSSNPPQIIILDWMMPKMNGIEVLQRLRSPNFPVYVFVIFLTAKSEVDHIIEALDSGADDFLTKPCDLNELQARIRAGERILNLEHNLAEKNNELEKINVKLKKSEEQFRGAFDNAPIGVALINSEGHFLRVNRMFCKMLKYSSKELKDKSVIDIVHLDDKENCIRFIKDIFSGKIADTHHEIRYVSKEGSILWVRIKMALHREYSNNQIEIILQAIDISQHKEAEEIAVKVQKNLLPGVLPDILGVNIKWSIKTCDELAGDTLNVFWIRDNYIGFYVIDVSGHGLAASLLSVKLSTIFSPYQIWNPSIERKIDDNSNVSLRPAKLLNQLNEYFPIDLDSGQYFTIVYGYMNVETHELCFSSAGHPAPIHLSKNEKAKIIKSKSLPIGFMMDAKYSEHKINLMSGDRVYFYTDGIVEAKARNGEEFGLHNLTKAVNESYENTLDASFCLLDEMMVNWNGKTGG